MKTYQLKLFIIAGFMAMTALSSCMFDCEEGSGHQATEQRKMNEFSKITISGAYKVIIKQDSSLSLKISADDNLIKYIHTSVSGGRLHIYNSHNFCNASELVINVGVRNLEEIKGSGAVMVESDGKLNAKDLALKITGAAKIDLDLDAARVFTETSGAAEIALKGKAQAHTIRLSGAAKINAFDFVVDNYIIKSTGAAHSQINVLHQLDVRASGASDVQYKGNPDPINEDTSGASSIHKAD